MKTEFYNGYKIVDGHLMLDDLNVENLYLSGCTFLTHLPENLSVSDSLYLSGCTSLTHLPENLNVEYLLELRGCTSLTHLPENLNVECNLVLSGCTSLTHLPENLNVKYYLVLSGCTSLTRLPENLNVGRLDLSGCTSLDYPCVHGCGDWNRTIYLDLKDKSLIRIGLGSFRGTREEAHRAIDKKYTGLSAETYKNQVDECFIKFDKFSS